MGGRSTTDAIQSLRVLMEKYRDARIDLFLVFIDLEKAFDRVPRDLIWAALRWMKIPEAYVKVIIDMYREARTKVRCTSGFSDSFNVYIGVHQGSVLSPLLFIAVIYYLTRDISVWKVFELLFTDDIILGSEDLAALQRTLNMWQATLERAGLKISVPKTEFLHCKFSNPDAPQQDLFLNGQQLKHCTKFKHFGSIVNDSATCEDDVKHRISDSWMKWRENSSIFCDRRMPLKLKGKVHSAHYCHQTNTALLITVLDYV